VRSTRKVSISDRHDATARAAASRRRCRSASRLSAAACSGARHSSFSWPKARSSSTRFWKSAVTALNTRTTLKYWPRAVRQASMWSASPMGLMSASRG